MSRRILGGQATHLQEKYLLKDSEKRGLNKLVEIEEIGRSWQEWKKNSFIVADRDEETSWTTPGGIWRRGPDDNQVNTQKQVSHKF